MGVSADVVEREKKADRKQGGKKVIGVMSGRRGAGKSLITAVLAVKMNGRGYSVAVLDADVDQPTIGTLFGLSGPADAHFRVFPQSSGGIQVVTVAPLLTEQDEPMSRQARQDTIRHCADDVLWTDLEVMLVDMPWGTGAEARLVLDAVDMDGMLLVTSPQELVSITVADAAGLAREANVPLLGVVENMSYVVCPGCGGKISAFGDSHLGETAEKHGLRVLDVIPVEPRVARLCGMGKACGVECGWLEETVDAVLMWG